jgi:hypothetical protein
MNISRSTIKREFSWFFKLLSLFFDELLRLQFFSSGYAENISEISSKSHLKVPKCEIFDHLDFHDFYSIKSLWEGFGVKIKKLL